MPKQKESIYFVKMTSKEAIIEKLTKFRLVDKYLAFHEIMPGTFHADKQQQLIVSDILDNCAKELIYLYKEAKKNPLKSHLKKVIFLHMELITHSLLDTANKEFAFRLCWFLAEKTATHLPKQTAKKYWGYWQVENNEVRTVAYRKPQTKMGGNKKTQ